jgi:hypothetical protein
MATLETCAEQTDWYAVPKSQGGFAPDSEPQRAVPNGWELAEDGNLVPQHGPKLQMDATPELVGRILRDWRIHDSEVSVKSGGLLMHVQTRDSMLARVRQLLGGYDNIVIEGGLEADTNQFKI